MQKHLFRQRPTKSGATYIRPFEFTLEYCSLLKYVRNELETFGDPKPLIIFYFADCFVLDNGTLTNNASVVASELFEYLEEQQHCIGLTEKVENVCTNCSVQYEKLNYYFNDIKKTFGDFLCFDIVDAVNIN